MGNRLLRMVMVLSFSFAAGNAAGQIYPGEEIKDGGVGECRLDTCL